MRDDEFTTRALEAAIRIGLVAILVVWCLQIVAPFVIPVLWGLIIALAVAPLYDRLHTGLGDRAGFAATLMTAAMLLVLVLPLLVLGAVLAEDVQTVAEKLRQGSVIIPPPDPRVETWPVIGKPLSNFWQMASVNLQGTLDQLEPQIRATVGWLLETAAGAGLAMLQFIAAVIIAGFLLAHGSAARSVAMDVGRRLAGDQGVRLVNLAEATVRSVTRGVLGVAVIQALLAGGGLVVAGVPGAGLWAFLCLILAMMQIGVGPVMVPAAIYVFWVGETVTAVLFLVWSVVVILTDNVLKPLLLGRGVDVPMVVIFLGTIGGMLLWGIIGLFVGAVVLAMGYTLFWAWLDPGQAQTDGPVAT